MSEDDTFDMDAAVNNPDDRDEEIARLSAELVDFWIETMRWKLAQDDGYIWVSLSHWGMFRSGK